MDDFIDHPLFEPPLKCLLLVCLDVLLRFLRSLVENPLFVRCASVYEPWSWLLDKREDLALSLAVLIPLDLADFATDLGRLAFQL